MCRILRFARAGVGVGVVGMGGNGNAPESEPEVGDGGAEAPAPNPEEGEERRVDEGGGRGVESERWAMEGPAALSMRKRAAPFLSSDSW